jgi:hypothetical protein
MEIRSSLTAGELREVARLSRSRFFWLRFAATNWYATLLAVALIVVVTNGAIHHQQIDWRETLIVLAVVAALYAVSWFRYTRKFSRLASRSAARNRTCTLEADGIHTQSESGAMSFTPWRAFDLCFEGKLIFLLKGKNAIMAVPFDQINRDSLGTYLRSNIVAQMLK